MVPFPSKVTSPFKVTPLGVILVAAAVFTLGDPGQVPQTGLLLLVNSEELLKLYGSEPIFETHQSDIS